MWVKNTKHRIRHPKKEFLFQLKLRYISLEELNKYLLGTIIQNTSATYIFGACTLRIREHDISTTVHLYHFPQCVAEATIS